MTLLVLVREYTKLSIFISLSKLWHSKEGLQGVLAKPWHGRGYKSLLDNWCPYTPRRFEMLFLLEEQLNIAWCHRLLCIIVKLRSKDWITSYQLCILKEPEAHDAHDQSSLRYHFNCTFDPSKIKIRTCVQLESTPKWYWMRPRPGFMACIVLFDNRGACIKPPIKNPNIGAKRFFLVTQLCAHCSVAWLIVVDT